MHKYQSFTKNKHLSSGRVTIYLRAIPQLSENFQDFQNYFRLTQEGAEMRIDKIPPGSM